MASFDLNIFNKALSDTNRTTSGVDFSGKSLKLDTEKDAQPIIDAINKCPDLQYLTLTGNTLGVAAAEAIAKALEHHPELKVCKFSDMFTGRMKTEIPPALKALGDGMIAAGARLQELDLSDNAFGPIGVEGLAKLLASEACSQLQELRLNNNGLGITGGRLLAAALRGARRLRVFVAGRNRLENDGAKALAAVFKDMGSLEEVSMPQNGIYHVGVAALAAALGRNQRLRALNLNDNTVGPKGAQAVAAALPSLKNLKAINFGDCLLKSKGARALAVALKEHSHQLESLDLSHNEIGREACLEVADAVATAPGSRDRLARVVLAGNSLGGASNKKTIRDKLGSCAELSDGEGSDNEYVTDSDEGEESDEEEGSEQDRSDEETQINETVDIVQDITLDSSGVEEVETDVGNFLKNPTVESLDRLGPNAADVIDAHLQSIKDTSDLIQAYVEATLCVSGLSGSSAAAATVSQRLYPLLLERVGQRHAAAWLLADALLRGLGLIKSENKQYKVRWSLASCFRCLGAVIEQDYFPAALRDTLRFFIRGRLPQLPQDAGDAVRTLPALMAH